MMSELMDPPKKSYVTYAHDLLRMYKILDSTQTLESKLSSDILQFSSLDLNRSLFLIFAFQLHCAKEASIIIGMIETLRGRIQGLFIKADAICDSDCKSGAKKYMKKIAHKKSDHLTLLNIFDDFRDATDKEAWARKNSVKLGLMKKSKEASHQYFHKLLQAVRAPQIAQTGGVEMKSVDVGRRLIEALKRSHQHLTAINLRSTYARIPHEAQIQQSSFLHQNHSKKELATKKIIYDGLGCTNGSWEFSIVTII